MAASMTRTFTLEEANRTLPLVSRIVRDIVRYHRQWRDLMLATEVQAALSTPVIPDPEAEMAEREIQRLAEEIAECVAELEVLGVTFKGFELGLVDFPSQIGGRPAYLCWRLGEQSVEHWHELDSGYAERKLISPHAMG
jgi:hypothetical protein